MASSGLKPTAGFLFGMAAEAATDLQKTGVHDEIAISVPDSKEVLAGQLQDIRRKSGLPLR